MVKEADSADRKSLTYQIKNKNPGAGKTVPGFVLYCKISIAIAVYFKGVI